jgi:hypothetical protein
MTTLALGSALAFAATAAATAPGRNGDVAFRRYLDSQQSQGAVEVVAAAGGPARALTHPGPGVVDDQPDFAPDGSVVLFTRCGPDGPCHLWTVRREAAPPAPSVPSARRARRS